MINTLLGGDQLPWYDESLRIELLKLATLLIEHAPDQLVEHRKELIKFAWNHLKSEDTQSKQCAYVNVCRFIQVYDTPPKIILQVYVALLRTFQPDARALVKCAEGTELRNELANSTAALVATTFDAKFTVANPALATQTRLQEAQLRFQGIVLVHTLVKRMPAWLPNQPDVLRKLTDIWLSAERKQRLTSEEQMPLEQIVESKLLIKCFVSYCRHHASEGTMGSRQVELLFMMLSIFSEHTLVNYSFLKTFYLVEVAQEYTAEHKAECIKHLLLSLIHI